MNRGKKLFVFVCVFLLFMGQLKVTKAESFDIGATEATYNSNTGILTIYDATFAKTDYQNKFSGNASRMRLGNVSLSGAYEANNEYIKFFISNKNEVNQQPEYTTSQTLSNALFMDSGAIVHSYRPPNSINVQIDSNSKAKTLNVTVVGIQKPMKVHDFYSNVSTLEGEGNVVLSITGENLQIATFSVLDQYTGNSYALAVNSSGGSVTIARPSNTTDQSRVDTFLLYINGMDSQRSTSLTILPKPKPKPNPPVEDSSQDNGSNNSTSDDEQTSSKPSPGGDTSSGGSNKPSQDNPANNGSSQTDTNNKQTSTSNGTNAMDGKNQKLATGTEPKLNEVFGNIVKKAENVIVGEEVGQHNLESEENEEVKSDSKQNIESDKIDTITDNKPRNTTSDTTDDTKDPSNIMLGFFIFVVLCGITTGYFLFQKKQKKDINI